MRQAESGPAQWHLNRNPLAKVRPSNCLIQLGFEIGAEHDCAILCTIVRKN
jgi:hypothetical protein